MALIAYWADTGAEVESFSTTREQWAQWRKLPVGAFLVGRQRVPAVLKRSPLGLQFFACAQGYGGSSEPETVEHQMAKIALVKGLRAVGVAASVEWPGCSSLGEEWVADVFAQTSSGPMVFEVQMSQQHWDDYRLRTRRYAASGARCMWLIRDIHYNAFTKARTRHLTSQGLTLQQAMNQGMPDIPAFPLVEVAHWTRNPDSVRAAVFPLQRGAMTHRLRLEHFSAGAALGYVRFGVDGFGHENWHWTVPQEGLLPSLPPAGLTPTN